MLMVIVSLAMVCAPAPEGITSTFTVPLVVKTLITELTTELIVVSSVAAPDNAGARRMLRIAAV